MGWGATLGTADDSYLHFAIVPIVSVKNCSQEGWINENVVLEGMICAGYEEGKIDPSEGDSGGPLVREINSPFELVGVMSWEFGCAQTQSPGVYTDTFFYLDWILEVTGEPNYGSSTNFESSSTQL